MERKFINIKAQDIPEDIVYARRYGESILYLRRKQGRRKYPPPINGYDYLYFVGVLNLKTKAFAEFPYSFDDQKIMWQAVIENLVLMKERVRHAKEWKEFMDDLVQKGILEKFEG